MGVPKWMQDPSGKIFPVFDIRGTDQVHVKAPIDNAKLPETEMGVCVFHHGTEVGTL